MNPQKGFFQVKTNMEPGEPIITGQPPTGFISTKCPPEIDRLIDTIVIREKYKWTPEEKIKVGWTLHCTNPATGSAQWKRPDISILRFPLRPPLKSTFNACGGGRIV